MGSLGNESVKKHRVVEIQFSCVTCWYINFIKFFNYEHTTNQWGFSKFTAVLLCY